MAEQAAVMLPEQQQLVRRPSWQRRYLRIAQQNPLGVLGALLTLLLIVVGVFAPLLAPHASNDFVARPGLGPSWTAPFGTDKFGEDIFSRVIRGARISLEVGFISVAVGTIIGTIIGAWSGFKGGIVDSIIQRIVDTMIAFPALVFLLVIVRLLNPSIENVIIAVGVLIIPSVARIVRGGALSERNNLYIEAARSIGASDTRILFKHIIPNIFPLAIVIATTLLGTAILAEASLSFLGLGIPPPNPSWGTDISTARSSFPYNVSAALFPGIAISLTVLGFNLLGDSLRDILDPRLRGR
jgi:ABC-type dipeptide/oligopeptide/nickel transport system permease subunit